jgi:dipeptidyl aminopeptidase/acylaminoacyl peptidase
LLLLWGERDDFVGRRNIDGLSSAMRERGGQVEAKLYPELDHVNILLALSRPLRDRGPVLADIAAFARRVTG